MLLPQYSHLQLLPCLNINKQIAEEFGLEKPGDTKQATIGNRNTGYKISLPISALFNSKVDTDTDTSPAWWLHLSCMHRALPVTGIEQLPGMEQTWLCPYLCLQPIAGVLCTSATLAPFIHFLFKFFAYFMYVMFCGMHIYVPYVFLVPR